VAAAASGSGKEEESENEKKKASEISVMKAWRHAASIEQ